MLCHLAAAAAAKDAVGEAGGGGSSSSGGDVNSAALWLLVLGCCCTQWAANLTQLQQQGVKWVHLIKQEQQQQWVRDAEGNMPEVTTSAWCFARVHPLLLNFAHTLQDATAANSSITASLEAAGYDMGPIQQGLDALAALYPDLVQTYAVDAVNERVAGLIGVLEGVGKALSVFAVPNCCNNPSNMSGVNEYCVRKGMHLCWMQGG